MTDTITILCKPLRIRVGDYFPVEFELLDTLVAVKVPLDNEHVDNCEEVKDVAELKVTPILTTTGLRWCYNQLRGTFNHDDKKSTNDDDPDNEPDQDSDYE